MKKRKEISKNEIISSSDDDNLSVDDAIEEKSDSDFEDTQELAYHKAKQFIAELEVYFSAFFHFRLWIFAFKPIISGM